ncbi:MAG: electron transport complex subunit RsxE, partial [Lachnospiraceae bacterium]|nr:electron transport complex subunit RsxE [Lachnospiraceae bacterium]
MSALSERLLNGIYKENPTFVLMLGMCPTLAVTTSAVNGLGMGVSTMVVLAMSNLLISLLRKVIPDKIRIPAFIVIIASFVTIVELVMKGYIPSLYNALGLYIPLIVVNCIILGRAESYAYSHSALLSLFDGFGMGMGFTIALTIIGAFREVLGSGKVFNHMVMPEGFIPVSIFVMAPGAFFVLALLTAIQNKIKEIGERHGKDMSKIQSGCGGNCLNCDKECKVLFPEAEAEEEAAENSSDAADDLKEQEGESADGEIEDTDTESVSSKGLKERLFGRFKKRDEEASPESEEGDKECAEEPEEAQESDGATGEESDISEPSEPVGVAGSGDEDTSEHGQDTDEHNEQSEPEQEEHTEE